MGKRAPERVSLVGREEELAVLRTSLDSARSGRARLVILAGDAGMGKTLLADTFSERAREAGAHVFWGRCWEVGGAPGYWPWIQILRACLRDREDRWQAHVDGARALLTPLLQAPTHRAARASVADPAQERFALFDAAAIVLRAQAAVEPTVVVLDDLHAADEPSLLMLRHLVGELTDVRIVFVALYRELDLVPEDPRMHHLARLAREPIALCIRLSPLTGPQIALIIERSGGEAPSEALVRVIADRTEGNPLFVHEMSRLLEDTGQAGGGSRQLTAPALPHGIKQVIGRRLEGLSPESRSVLEVAAVVGREFGSDLLLELGISAPALLAALDEAIAARVLQEAPGGVRWRFSHVLIRDVLYESIGLQARKTWHVRVGRAIARLAREGIDDPASELAHHFMLGLPGGDARRARRYSTLAGRRASAAAAHEEAVRHHSNALVALDAERGQDHLRCDILVDLGAAQQSAGMPAMAAQSLLTAGALAERLGLPDPLARAALTYGGSLVWARPGLDGNLVPLLERALAMRSADDELRVRLLGRLAGALRSDPDATRRLALSAEAVAAARRLGDPPALIHALVCRQMAIGGPDSLDEMERLSDEMTALVDTTGDRDLLGDVLGWCRASWLTTIGPRLEELERLLARTGAVVEPLRLPAKSWYLGVMRTIALLATGRFEGIDEIIESTLEAGRRGRAWDAEVSHRLTRFTLARERDELEDVLPMLASAAHELPGYWLFEAARVYAEVETGHSEEARRHLAEMAPDGLRRLPRDSQWLWAMVHVSEAAIALDDREAMSELLELLSPYQTLAATASFEVIGGPVGRAVGDLAAALGHVEAAEAGYGAALALTERTSWRPWEAWTRLSYGAWMLHDGPAQDIQAAERELRRAAAIADELGMPALRRRVAEAVRGTPSAQIARDAPMLADGRVGSLTREGDVWAITFEGRTVRMQASKGMAYLADLLLAPGREIAAIDLASGDAPERGRVDREEMSMVRPMDDPILDGAARAAYRDRLVELEAEIDEATSMGDQGRAAALRDESAYLTHELAAAVGLLGRSRSHADPAERARQSVSKAIRAALSRIERHEAPLGEHLRHAIRTGVMCSYSPDPRAAIRWNVVLSRDGRHSGSGRSGR